MAETGQKLFPGKDDPSGSPKARRRRIRVHTVIGLVLTVLVVVFSLIVLIHMRQRVEAAAGAERELLRRGLQNDYIVCASLLIVALGITFGIAPMKRHIALCIVGCTLWGLALLVVGEAAYLSVNTVIHSNDRDDTSGARYAVVIGDPLQNRQVSGDLDARISTAADWWKAQNDDDIILYVSNASALVVESDFEEEATTAEAAVEVNHAGRVKNQGNTPSAVMKSSLDKLGVPKYAVKEEKVSQNVRECFEQLLVQNKKLTKDTPIAVITNGSYMNDTVRIAREVGFTNISRVPAASGFSGYLTDVLWETWLRCDPVIKAAMDGES